MLSPIEEIRFWTGILRDHGEFILTSLSYNEQEAMNYARFYRDSFASLHERIKAPSAASNPNTLNEILAECINTLSGFINFKKVLLRNLLECQLNTSLTPTFYNHMINEAMEFYKYLFQLQNSIPINPVVENICLHKTWLADAAGHAASIAGDLDPVEKMLINEAQEFEKCFNCLLIKNNELGMMLTRTCLKDGALKHLNEEVKKLMEDFIHYLDKIRMLTMECKVLSVLKPLIPDHMIREELYYLKNLAALEQSIKK